MELRHLRYFIAVAEESTIVAAAKRLRVAQPALTRQIHDFEREIGVDVFARGSKGVQLTAAGEVCLVSARHILRHVEMALARARGASRGVVGRCIICVGARALSSGLIARIVAYVHANYPEIELSVSEAAGTRQWNDVRSLEADIGMGAPAPPEFDDLISEISDYDSFDSIVISSAHVLASRSNVRLDELAEETFLALASRQMAQFTSEVKKAFSRADFKPKHEREFEDVLAVAATVTAGQGWTLVPSRHPSLAPTGSAIVRLDDFEVPLAHAIIWRQAETRAVVHRVIECIRAVFAEDRRAEGLRPLSAPSESTAAEQKMQSTDATDTASTIELRHLRYFCAVVDARSFGRAAERLHLTQPSLSRQIRDLERTAGIALLERDARGVTATAAGESFYKSARSILDEAATMKPEADRARRGMLSRCVIAAVPTPNARMLLSGLYHATAIEMPTLQLRVEEYHTPRQPALLREGTVDVGICHATPLSLLEERGVRRERLLNDVANCALVASSGALAKRSHLTLSDLSNIPFLFPSRAFQPGLHDQLCNVFRSRGFQPRVDQSYDGLRTVWTLVAEGRGWGLGFQSQCDDPPAGTVALPITGFSMPWGVDLLYRADESRPSILQVLEMLHDIARAYENQAASA